MKEVTLYEFLTIMMDYKAITYFSLHFFMEFGSLDLGSDLSPGNNTSVEVSYLMIKEPQNIKEIRVILFRGSTEYSWVALGTKELDLQTWQNTCVSVDLETGETTARSKFNHKNIF